MAESVRKAFWRVVIVSGAYALRGIVGAYIWVEAKVRERRAGE